MVELILFNFFNATVARENKLWTVKAESDALGPGLGRRGGPLCCSDWAAVGYVRPSKSNLAVGHGAVSCSSLLLFQRRPLREGGNDLFEELGYLENKYKV